MSILEAVLNFEREAALLNEIAASMNNPDLSDADLQAYKSVLTEIARNPAHPMYSKAASLLPQVNAKIGETSSNEAVRDAVRNLAQVFALSAQKDALALETWSLWSDKEKERFESIDPNSQQQVMQFDADGNPVGMTTVTGQKLRDSASLLQAIRYQDDPSLSEEERENNRKKINLKLYGTENKPQDVAKVKEGDKKILEAVDIVQGNTAANSATTEERKQIGQNTIQQKKELQEVTKLEAQKAEAAKNPQVTPPTQTQIDAAKEKRKVALANVMEDFGDTKEEPKNAQAVKNEVKPPLAQPVQAQKGDGYKVDEVSKDEYGNFRPLPVPNATTPTQPVATR